LTHPIIALRQTRLTPEFFTIELLENNVYRGGMSILSILLSLEIGCHRELDDGDHEACGAEDVHLLAPNMTIGRMVRQRGRGRGRCAALNV
jgi:hypothetical protein